MIGSCKLTNKTLGNIRDEINRYAGKNNPKAQLDIKKLLEKVADDYDVKSTTRAKKIVNEALDVIQQNYGDDMPDWANLENLLSILMGSDLNLVENSEFDPDPQRREDFDDLEDRKKSKADFLIDAYGRDRRLSADVLRAVSTNIYDTLFVNRGGTLRGTDKTCVEGIHQMNRNILSYLNQLFEDVSRLLITLLPEGETKEKIKNTPLFDSQGNYTGILEDPDVMAAIKLHIEPLKSDISRLFKLETREGMDLLKYDAYNSYITLTNLDNYLSINLGDIIKFRPGTIGKRVSGVKYFLSDKGQHTYWDVNDDLKVELSTDLITRLSITTTPVIDLLGNKTGKNLTFNDWSHIIATIKSLSLNGASDVNIGRESRNFSFSNDTERALSGITTLRLLIDRIPSNPEGLYPALFEILSNQLFINRNPGLYKGLTRDIINKINSINRGLFNGDASLRTLSTNFGNYYSYIVLSAISIHDNPMILYYRDIDGIIKVRHLSDVTYDTIIRSVKDGINALNSRYLISDWDAYAATLGIEGDGEGANLKRIKFKFGDMTVYVRSDGAVTFVNKPVDLKVFIPLLDEILGLNILNNDSLRAALLEQPDTLNRLLTMASRTVFCKYLLNVTLKNSKNIARDVELLGFKNLKIQNGELSLVHGSDNATLDIIAEAIGVSRGLTTASQVLDGEHKANAKQTFNRLFGSLTNQWELLNRKQDSITKDFSILGISGLFGGILKVKEFNDVTTGSKVPTRMNVGELITANFLYDYIGGINNTASGKDIIGSNKVLFLTSVNADKDNSSKMIIDLNKIPVTNNHPLGNTSLANKALKDYSRNELITFINYELGNYYQRMIDVVRTDLGKIHYLLASGLENNFEEFNALVKAEHPNLTPKEYLDLLVREYNELNPTDIVELIDVTHYRTLSNGDLAANQVMLEQINKYSNGSHLFWYDKELELIKTLLDEDFKLNLSNTKLREISALRDWCRGNGWLDDSGNMILCKATVDGVLFNIANQSDARMIFGKDWFDRINDIELNPHLSRYNMLDHLFTLEFLNTTVGSFTNHPYKGELRRDELGRTNLYELEASQLEAQNKRNVSFTAPVISFLLNNINGIADTYNIAVIDEFLDLQGNVNGLLSEINAIDGATWVNPITVILENYSLGGSKAGTIKKPFIHFYNERTGTGGIIKTASFGLNNNDIRNSPEKALMMRKMTDHVWRDLNGNEFIVDIFNSEEALDPEYDIPYSDIYYSRAYLNEETGEWENRYYTIVETENIGDNTYNITEVRVDTNGEEMIDEETGEYIEENHFTQKVNTNYSLWKLFGGEHSMELRNKKLAYSNTSVENCAVAAINLGIRLNDLPIKTLSDFYQPLKHSDVHYVCTKGAVKQGAANINSSKRFTDDTPYNIQRIKMYNAGIVLDKEHTIEFDEVASASTQAITSSVLRGRTFESADRMYKALALLSNLNAGEHVEAAKKIFKNPRNVNMLREFREILNSSLLKTLLRDSGNYNNFALSLARELVDRARSGDSNIELADMGIPLSDNTIYNKVLTSINSYLTKTGIRVKLPGTLAILAPSNRMYKLYNGKKYSQYINAEAELAEILRNTAPLYTKEINEDGRFNTNISNLKLNRTYNIVKINDDGSTQEETKLIATPTEYRTLKSDVEKGNIQSITENIIVGRDLSSYNVTFKDVDGNSFLLYDLESIEALYRLEDINKIEDAIAKYDAFNGFINHYDNLGRSVRYHNRYEVNQLESIINNGGEANLSFYELANDALYKVLRKTIDKWKQFDLNNLSKLISENRQWYDELLAEREELIRLGQSLDEWYERFGLSINVKFGLADNGSIKILKRNDTQSHVIDDSNFEDVKEQVDEWVDGISKVIIGKEIYEDGLFLRHIQTSVEVDKNSIQEEAYEAIVPLTFGKLFGLTLDTNLTDIVNDENYFIKQLINRSGTKTNSGNYSIELKVNSGNHYYILDKNSNIGSELTKVESPLVIEEDGVRYKVDYDGNIQYQLDDSAEIYTDQVGNEIIVTDDLKFYMDNFDYYSIKLSRDLLLNEGLFNTIMNLMKDSNNTVAKDAAEDISNMDIRTAINTNNRENSVGNLLQIINNPRHSIYRKGRSMYNSFIEALNIIAARTPGLSMLSFMAMKIAGFDNSGTNVTYVSTMLNLLQGSDYDIDTVSLFTYDINNNGTIQFWSPYANLVTAENLKASKSIALPTGREHNGRFETSDQIDSCMRVIRDHTGDTGCLRFRRNSYDDYIDVSIDTSTPEKILDFNKLLDDVDNGLLVMPENIHDFVLAFNELFSNEVENRTRIKDELLGSDPNDVEYIQRKTRNRDKFQENVVSGIYTLIIDLINKHNLYLVNSSRNKTTKSINNYLITNQLDIISDAANLELSQSPTDDITKPLKNIADRTSIANKMRGISVGNVAGKFRYYTQAVVGKEDVGIAAVGMKVFGGLTLYVDRVLRYGTKEEQNRLISKAHKFNKGGNIVPILANAYTLNPNSIKDISVLKAMAKTDNLSDASLILAAIASLAADNAKDLKLGKLNAGTRLIDMYTYGTMVGKSFDLLSSIITSNAGLAYAKLLGGNVFSDTFGYTNSKNVHRYFLDYLDKRFLNKFDINKDLYGNAISRQTLLSRYIDKFDDVIMNYNDTHKEGLSIDPRGKDYDFNNAITTFALEKDIKLETKLKILDQIPAENIANTYGREMYNLLRNFIRDYVIQVSDINTKDVYDLKILAEGASESRTLGQMYSTNQRIETQTDKFFNQLRNFEDVFTNRNKKNETKLDVIEYAFDPNYRDQMIKLYEKTKHTFNILDSPNNAPHYMAYIEALATALSERRQSFKFRNAESLTKHLKKTFAGIKDLTIVKGVENFINDYLRNEWMMRSRQTIRIPKGNKVFNNDGDIIITGGDTDILLGSDLGNASFRLFMENTIIPDLKERYSNKNSFIRDLSLISMNRTISKNPINIYSLTINMSPRGEAENMLLDDYKASFNDIAQDKYVITDSKGRKQTITIGDLFTYYAMIAHNWSINERSLVPILLDYQANSALISDFYDFEASYDREGKQLQYALIEKDLMPYIALSRNPLNSKESYIYVRDRSTNRKQLMLNMAKNIEGTEASDEALDAIAMEETFSESDLSNSDYMYVSNRDWLYFPKGLEADTERHLNTTVNTEDGNYKVSISYDIGKIEDLKNINNTKVLGMEVTTPDGSKIRPDITELPLKKVNGNWVIDVDHVIELARNDESKCF